MLFDWRLEVWLILFKQLRWQILALVNYTYGSNVVKFSDFDVLDRIWVMSLVKKRLDSFCKDLNSELGEIRDNVNFICEAFPKRLTFAESLDLRSVVEMDSSKLVTILFVGEHNDLLLFKISECLYWQGYFPWFGWYPMPATAAIRLAPVSNSNKSSMNESSNNFCCSKNQSYNQDSKED